MLDQLLLFQSLIGLMGLSVYCVGISTCKCTVLITERIMACDTPLIPSRLSLVPVFIVVTLNHSSKLLRITNNTISNI